MTSGRRVTIDEFWSQCLKTPSCWIWQGGTNKNGYGVTSFESQVWLAHRFAYQLVKGPIPIGFGVLHRCNNPPCVNPDHLYAGDQKANMRDAIHAGTVFHKNVAHGEATSMAKLTEREVREIRRKYQPRIYGTPRLAKEYHVTQANIHCIISNQTWRHLLGDHGD